MAEITFDPALIRAHVGLDCENSFLYPHMELDSATFSSPILLTKDDGSKYLLVKDIERGNFEEQSVGASVLYYRPYVTFDSNGTDGAIPDGWAELVEELIGNEAVRIDPNAHLSAYDKLRRYGQVPMPTSVPWWRVYLYEVSRDDVTREFSADYEQALEAAKGMAERLNGAELLADLLVYAGDTRFSTLDRVLEEAGVGAVILTSPLNGQEVSGLPYDFFKSARAFAVYTPGAVYVMADRPLPKSYPRLMGEFQALRDAFRSLKISSLPVGVEENNFPCGLLNLLGLEPSQTHPLSLVLRRWREERAAEELPYYLIAAQATRYSIEGALQVAAEAIEKGKEILETDVEKTLYSLYKEYELSRDLKQAILPYFLVLHAGHRTRRPNLPQFFPIDQKTRTLKIDAGVMVLDSRGLIRGVSDLCRTLTMDDPSRELYHYLDQLMTEVAIPAAVPGRRGEKVYEIGTAELFAREEHWADSGLLPKGYGLAEKYNRNIGHVLGKQEPSTLGFEKGNTATLKEGMVACIEYQWPYYPYAVGVEDMFIVTRYGSVNLTR